MFIKNTIHMVKPSQCTGCASCYNKCPVNAISMEADSAGFLFPQIDPEQCIRCGQCLAACPTTHQIERKDEIKKVFSATMPEDIQKVSASGGAFTLLADYVFKRNGYVCGVVYSDDYRSAHHCIISSKEELQALRGSKYFQSEVGLVFYEIKKLLTAGHYVLFSGTPCQAAGLKAYLGKPYEKLIIMDILCHGVPAPGVYRSYLDEIAQGRKITRVDFREKAHWGWGSASSIFFEDGSVYRSSCTEDPFFRGFLGGMIARESCGTCPYASPYTHVSDITLGDFWGIGTMDPESHDKNGVSLILTNTEKGLNIWNEAVSESATPPKHKEQPMANVIELCKKHNGMFLYPKKPHWGRKHFFEAFALQGFHSAFDKAINSQYDVGVVGWWNNDNYGGCLTYYALNRVLQSMGLSTLMIRHIRWNNERNLDLNRLIYRFALKYYNISNNYEKWDLHYLNNHVKAFISGSDQLFNPALWLYSGPEYFLSFVNNNRKIISYASSFGNGYDPANSHHAEIAYHLRRFDALSVREDYGVDICKDNFGLDVKHVMDPVFLCDPKEFHKLADSAPLEKDKPFMTNYILDPTEAKRDLVLKLARHLGVDYVNLVDATNAEKNAADLNLPNTKPNIDVEDWLFYYKNADFILTDSFHGTCFAIIFRKPFISIANKKRGAHRFESVLKAVGLLDRMVYDIEDIWKNPHLFEPIDYDKVAENIASKASDSMEWLKNAIFTPRNLGTHTFKVIDERIRTMESRLRKEQSEQIEQLKRELEAVKAAKAEAASAPAQIPVAEITQAIREQTASINKLANTVSEQPKAPETADPEAGRSDSIGSQLRNLKNKLTNRMK